MQPELTSPHEAISDPQPPSLIERLLEACVQKKASDLYLTFGSPPCLRVEGRMEPIGEDTLSDWDIQNAIEALLEDDQIVKFKVDMELNTAIHWHNLARFRINVYRQQQHDALVLRRIETNIPTLASLGLPEAYQRLILHKRGLILVVGQTGCGKSTSLAAMIGHRNEHGTGHIITIEDPIEFIHEHKGCIVSHRDIGIDTHSLSSALKNALRQHPDVILIGEIRDRDTMEYALNFSQTGHLCVATLHASNGPQAVERVANFFPEEMRAQALHSMANNLRGVLAQRLVPTLDKKRALAIEVLLNEGLATSLINEGRVKELKGLMEKNRAMGMQSFDQSLIDLYHAERISADVAVAESDNPANVRLAITQKDTAEKIRQISPKESGAIQRQGSF